LVSTFQESKTAQLGFPGVEPSIEIHPKVAVVDWEFASIGRGVNNDIAQLLAHLALLHTAATCKGNSIRMRELRIIASATAANYRRLSTDEGALWTGEQLSAEREGLGVYETELPFSPLKVASLRAKVLRCTFLIHGAEMMRCAFSQDWNCEDGQCWGMKGGSIQHIAAKHECVMIQAMVERALWYFRYAGENEKEFCSEENMRILRKAYHGDIWMMDLF
jgi:hypothetical protein